MEIEPFRCEQPFDRGRCARALADLVGTEQRNQLAELSSQRLRNNPPSHHYPRSEFGFLPPSTLASPADVKKPPQFRTWEISRIKGTPAAILGRIKAPTAESAVKEWIERFDITDPEQQSRLVARPVK